MSEGYGEHAERLAGYGVGQGELRDYKPFSLEDSDTLEANALFEQTNFPVPVLAEPRESCDGTQHGQTHPGEARVEHTKPHANVGTARGRENSLQPTLAPSSAIPEDAEEANQDNL